MKLRKNTRQKKKNNTIKWMIVILTRPLEPLFDMTTGYNGKFVLVGDFSCSTTASDGVVSKSLDRRPSRIAPGILRCSAKSQTPVHDILGGRGERGEMLFSLLPYYIIPSDYHTLGCYHP